jgi:Protein of unknown function C-terminus (DUF2399)
MANRLIAEVGAEPLLMSASDYEPAARSGRAALELSEVPVGASWDPLLRPTVTRFGVAVHQEAILDELLACLTPQAR